MKRKWKLF